jgi:hypothetical protein
VLIESTHPGKSPSTILHFFAVLDSLLTICFPTLPGNVDIMDDITKEKTQELPEECKSASAAIDEVLVVYPHGFKLVAIMFAAMSSVFLSSLVSKIKIYQPPLFSPG